MSFLKRFRRKKHSTGSTQSTSKMISDSGSYIGDFPMVNSVQDEETRSNNDSSPLFKKNLRDLVGAPERKLTAASVPSRRSPSPRTRRSDQASIVVLKAKLEELSGVVDPYLSVRSVETSVKKIPPAQNSFENELRFLDTRIRGNITNELDATHAWKALVGRINHPDRPSDPLFADIQLLNDEKKVKSPSEEILKTWSTTGRNRPRIQDLYDVLVDILQLKIAQRLMNEVQGTAVSLSLNADSEQITLHSKGGLSSNGCSVNFSNMKACLSKVYQICFNDVESATDHFSTTSQTKIGEGTFGVVYRVKIDGEDMAVKVFKEDISQIANEIEQLSTFDHPNVLPLYGIAVGEDSVCMITRYMNNGSLQQKLASTVLDWPLRLRILRDVAAGLEYVHSLNVLHRDVKPGNILLNENMGALIADFGLARKKQSFATSRTNIAAGSAFYMAPEVPHGIVTLASDVYSFGVVALEMFTGLPVFDASRPEELLTEHIAGKNSDEVCDTRIAQPSDSIKEEYFRTVALCLRSKRERPDMKYIHQQFQMFFEFIIDGESVILSTTMQSS